ncbi:formyltetrahydrofolate deformylase [Mucilaginibacter arboris]|uniref:Formyltetrahydrofolate deformylase n=1 Tax=Mucilaginibacter arboris TaxID=2682090 RepID=A0A7K1STQ9_9SPHI|nr:formyltetrahydrofolate deformylase [Mucilaginibacter arboris]MVN20674.1 formyltetrahydrofolate deformylase [Mucilaginibacter arboris]
MIILIQCKDQVGLVTSISGILVQQQLNIVSMNEHVDKAQDRFYMRLEVEPLVDVAALEAKIKSVLPEDAVIAINQQLQKKIVVLVTKEYHCLADILIRNFFGTLGASVLGVIGNYTNLQNICERFDVPFYPVLYSPSILNEEPEEQIAAIIRQLGPDYIVLAKFMRILSPGFVAKFPKQLINIHHSFLPAFVGASPYRQAFERGVKLIGATAHFVTNELDEGPIITQQIIPVNHSHTAADMMKAGQEIETSVLAKALQLVFDDRVFVYKNKTVVFE